MFVVFPGQFFYFFFGFFREGIFQISKNNLFPVSSDTIGYKTDYICKYIKYWQRQ